MATGSWQGSHSSPNGFYLDLKNMEIRNVNNSGCKSPVDAQTVGRRFKYMRTQQKLILRAATWANLE